MPKCVSKRKNGTACENWAMTGAERCRMHLGRKSSTHKAEVAAKRVVAITTRLAIEAGTVEAVTDPLTALSLLAGEAIRAKDVLAQMVSELEQLRYTGAGGEQVRAEAKLYGEWFDRATKVTEAAARLRIDDRLAVIAEAQARQLEVVLIAVLARFGLDGRSLEVRAAVAETIAALPTPVVESRS